MSNLYSRTGFQPVDSILLDWKPILLIGQMIYVSSFRLSLRTQIATLLLAWFGLASMNPPAIGQDQSIFQQYILQQKTEKAFRLEVVARSHDLIERVKQSCKLDSAQLEKLQLAAEGDVVRFYREFERVKSEVKGINRSDAQAFHRVWPILSPLSVRVQLGIFDDSALCHSVLKTTLNASQLEQFQTDEAKRLNYAFTATCKTAIVDLSREIPLTGSQRQKLLSIMLSVAKPKKSHPQLEYMLGMVILGKAIKQIEVESGLDKKQFDHLEKLLERVRGMEGNFEW